MQSLQDRGTPYSPYLHLMLVPRARLPFGQLLLRAQADFEQGGIVGRSDARRFRMLNDADTRYTRAGHADRQLARPQPPALPGNADAESAQLGQGGHDRVRHERRAHPYFPNSLPIHGPCEVSTNGGKRTTLPRSSTSTWATALAA